MMFRTTLESFDFVIPLYKIRWNTRAVLEGITKHYQPRSIHVITQKAEANLLKVNCQNWEVTSVYVHEEESFFKEKTGLSKDLICAELDLKKSLYAPGWFYQQLLKLGACDGIEKLSEWYVVWDSDLLPVNAWPLLKKEKETIKHTFALLQHNQWGNPQIVSAWEKWIQSILGIKPITDTEGTFIPHHMWFKQELLRSFKEQLNQYFTSDDSWLLLMMRSVKKFDTFSEYWSYASWVAEKSPSDLAFHPYEEYGATTERFFDDGTGLFSTALKHHYHWLESETDIFSPSYQDVESFIYVEYGEDQLPSSFSFESNSRHLKKDTENMHIEEKRSRWNLRRIPPYQVTN